MTYSIKTIKAKCDNKIKFYVRVNRDESSLNQNFRANYTSALIKTLHNFSYKTIYHYILLLIFENLG